MRKLTHEEVVTRQETRMEEPRLPFVVVLDNIRSLFNVGAVFRTADGAGAKKVWLCGITGQPPDGRIAKTALDAQERVPWEYRRDIHALLQELKAQGYQIVILEQTQQSIPHQDFRPRAPVCLVIGNEVDGVDREIVEDCDAAIEIEMVGVKNSLNVAVAFGIVAYHFRNCLKE